MDLSLSSLNISKSFGEESANIFKSFGEESTMMPTVASPSLESEVMSPRSDMAELVLNLDEHMELMLDSDMSLNWSPSTPRVRKVPTAMTSPRKLQRCVQQEELAPDKDVNRKSPSEIRRVEAAALSGPETPRTPKTTEYPRSWTPPGLVPKSKRPKPDLLKALLEKSIDQVSAALLKDPSQAKEPFWDHDCEPPLCCAVRLECSVHIVKLLLDHGADPEATNVRGRKPADILRKEVKASSAPTFEVVLPNYLQSPPAISRHVTLPSFSPGYPVPFFSPDSSSPAEIFGVAGSENHESWQREVADLLKQRQ